MSLEAEKISFQYENGGRRVLNQLSLSINEEDRIGLSAPSGFGKTTLCRILAGYEKPDHGQVRFDGQELPKLRGRLPIQLIWQHPEQAVNPRWRMRQVLREGGGVDPELVKRLGIREEWLTRYPAELSGGELQRFCIARALGRGTRILLADEITAMLDLVTQNEIWSVILEEADRRRIGMLVVSHSERLLKQVCSRVIRPWELQEQSEAGGRNGH